MSWLLSQALVEEYSGAICSGGKQSAQSKSTPTPLAYLQPDRMKAFSRLSRYGVTFEHLTADHGAAVLTSFLADFHVRTSVKQEQVPASMVNDQASGRNLSGLLARYDPVTCSWKTAQCSLLEDLEQSLETWPRSGSMLNGVCYLRPMLAPLTYAKEYGSWPTPTCSDVYTGNLKSSQQKPGSMHSVTLPQAVAKRAMWPTPSASEGLGGGSATSGMKSLMREKRPSGNHRTFALRDAVKVWPTPTASASKGSSQATLTRKSGRSRVKDRLDHSIMASDNGQLNPTWVEWLMGWPLGWTELKPSETVKFRLPPPRRGGNSLNEQESPEAAA
jgi:hypothetical protein